MKIEKEISLKLFRVEYRNYLVDKEGVIHDDLWEEFNRLCPNLNESLDDLEDYHVDLKITLTPAIGKKVEELTINLRLIDCVKNDTLCDGLGLNPWCVSEGADGDDIIQVPLSLAKKAGIL